MNGGAGVSPVTERSLLIVGALLISVLCGAFAATADFVWVLAVLCVLAAAVLVSSREATFWFVVITGLVMVGLVQLYLPGARYLKYVPPLAAAGLLLHVAARLLAGPLPRLPSTVPWFLAFLGISAVSMAANWNGVGMAVVGLKSYYPMWPLFLALAVLSWRPALLDAVPRVALGLAVLQLPFVAHQYFVLVPARQAVPGLEAVDVVAGTFGGEVFGGAANAVLTLFLITVIACLLGLWRQGVVGTPAMLIGVAVLLAPVFVNSSRIALFYLPLMFCVVLSSDIARRPLRALVALMAAVGLVVAMLTTYTALSQQPGTHSWQDLVTATYHNQLATERQRADNYSGLSRWTVLTYWAEHQRITSPVEILIGYGPGASRVQDDGIELAETLAQRRHGGRQIGYTALAALLWEVGVIGLLTVLAMFYAAFRQAGRQARFYAVLDPKRAGIAHGLRAAVLILAISIAHKDFLAFHVPYQTLVVCVLGYLAAQTNLMNETANRLREQAAAARAGRQP
jgi:hypothetical protein